MKKQILMLVALSAPFAGVAGASSTELNTTAHSPNVMSLPVPLSENELDMIEGEYYWVAIGAAAGGYEGYTNCEDCTTGEKIVATGAGALIGTVGGARGEAAQLAFQGAKHIGGKAVAVVGGFISGVAADEATKTVSGNIGSRGKNN